MAILVGGLLLLAGPSFLNSLSLTEEPDAGPSEMYVLAAGIFLIGALLSFPLGIFREALRGQNKLHLANIWDILFLVPQGVLITWGCLQGWNLVTLIAISVACTVLPLVGMAVTVCRHPQFRPSLFHFRFARVKSLAGFSLYAYLITMTNVVMGQTDQIFIGMAINVAAIALYMPGLKVSQIYRMLALQMQDALSPAAAYIHGMQDENKRQLALQDLFLNSQRWAMLIAIPAALPLLVMPEMFIGLLTGIDQPSAVMVTVLLVLILADLGSIIGNSVSKRILMMIDKHRFILVLSIIEAVINAGVTLTLLVLWQSVSGAAIGTLAACLILPTAVALPYAARTLGVSFKQLWTATFLPAILASILPTLLALTWFAFGPNQVHMTTFLLMLVLFAAATIGSWSVVGTTHDERLKIRRLLRLAR